MHPNIDYDRRRFLSKVAMTVGTASAAIFGGVAASARSPREFTAIGRANDWLNSPRPTADALLGKVVVVNFCTYSCVNWLRTLPYVRAWAQKYTPRGAVVIGVHTPEFAFEHDIANIRRAVQQMRIDYPMAVDNDYSIWRAFDNQYWPALYFLDARGRVRHRQFGEGEYQTSERTIQRLLREAGVSDVGEGIVSIDGDGFGAAADWANLRSPESYVGYARMENFASPDAAKFDHARTYRAPARLALNQWSLGGDWTIGRQATVLNAAPGRIVYRFHARDVHLVMGPSRPGESIRFRVSVDGQPPGAAHGLHVDENGNGTTTEHRLFQLIRQPRPIVERQFAIEFLDPGVEAFSFTFG
jgi:hypothetical protein